MRVAFALTGRKGRRNQPEAAKPGGSTLSALELARGLRDADIEPVILLHKDGATVTYVEAMGLRAEVLPLPWFDKRKPITDSDVSELYAALQREEPRLRALALDAVLTCDAHMHRTWGYCCERLAIPQVWYELGSFHHPPISLDHLRRAARIVTLSEYTRQLAPADIRPRVEIVLDSISVPAGLDKTADRAWLIGELGIAPECRVAVKVANNNPRKRWELFFESAARAAAARPGLHFVAVGISGAEFAGPIDRWWSGPLRNRLHVFEYRNDALRVMSGADAVVSTSRDEPMGRVIIQGLQCRSLVLAAEGGGHDAILREVAPWCLVSPDTAGEFARHFLDLDALLRQHEPRRAGVAAAVNAMFALDARLAKMKALLEVLREPVSATIP